MGFNRWTEETYATYASTTGYDTAPLNRVFTRRSSRPDFVPATFTVRESVDSENNPESLPFIFALDVSGSMGEYARKIAVTHLPKLMNGLLECSTVKDPHIMFMGIDDIAWNVATAVQASQFEADIKIIEQLRDINLVGGGGGNRTESYDLAWYFAAHKTKIDSFSKRNIPGFLFTFGDEGAPTETVSTNYLKSVFGLGEYCDMTPKQSLMAAGERYQVFHVVIEEGDFCQTPSSHTYVRNTWTELLGNNALFLSDVNYLADVVLATIRIAQGEDLNEVIESSGCKNILKHAFQNTFKSLNSDTPNDDFRYSSKR